jgi:NADH-quinone oxidoreductase subunit C
MTIKLEKLEQALKTVLGERILELKNALGELTIVVSAAEYLQVMRDLRDHSDTCFEELIDLCGVDYSTYADGAWDGSRYAVVTLVVD